MNNSVRTLFDNLKLPCGLSLKNRIVKAAMTEGLSIDGNANSRLKTIYSKWSQGGVGLLISGNVMVDRRYLERPGNIIIDEKCNKMLLAEWARSCQQNGTRMWLQLSHPGRQCTRWVNQEPVAPSAVELDLFSMFKKPRALEHDEIIKIIEQYANAAAIAKECGFDGVQIHGAHGFLISQFLSPLTNKRNDEWGGSSINRSRFLIEVIKAVRNQVGDRFAIGLKLNSSDFQKGGYSIEHCLELIRTLNQLPLDLLELSGGTYEQPQLLGHHGDPAKADTPKRNSTILREAYFVEYAKQAQLIATMPLMVTGGFRHKAAMQAALEYVDCIGIGRPFCVMPDWPNRMQKGQTQTLPDPERTIIGRGKWGTSSPWKSIQGLNIQGEVAWFYYQIIRLSDNKPLRKSKKIICALLFHIIREQWLAAKRRRQLRRDIE